jgi:hypothetical protein
VQQHVTSSNNLDAIKVLVEGKGTHVLKRKHWSVQQKLNSKSMPVDWGKKETSARI